MGWWDRARRPKDSERVLMPVQRSLGEPDNRTRDVVDRVSFEVDRLAALVTQLEQSVLIVKHLEEKRDNAEQP